MNYSPHHHITTSLQYFVKNQPILFILYLCLLLLYSSCSTSHPTIKKRFRLPPALSEASGLYYASADSLWWHNDSGDGPNLFLTDAKGQLIKKVNLPQIKHIDWEDLSSDDQGRIYIGDFGNNSNNRKDLQIYCYDPGKEHLDSIRFYYEDQAAFPPQPQLANFDMEGFFWFNYTLHLFSKNRLQKGNYYTKHYLLPANTGQQVARLRDSIYLRKRVVTSAAISPDRKMVALIGYNYKKFLGFLPTSAASMFLFTDFSDSHFLQAKMRRKRLSCIVATQYEAVDFINDELVYVASEKTAFIPARVKRKRVRKKKVVEKINVSN